MVISYLLIAGLGAVVFIIGLTWVLQGAFLSDVISFPTTCTEKVISLNKPGRYALCIHGANYIHVKYDNVFKVSDLNSQKKIPISENFIKPRFRRDWVMGIEYYHFKIEESGKYKIEINSPDDIRGENSRLLLSSILKISSSRLNLSIIIKETVSLKKNLFGILFLNFGLMAAIFFTLLALNPTMLSN